MIRERNVDDHERSKSLVSNLFRLSLRYYLTVLCLRINMQRFSLEAGDYYTLYLLHQLRLQSKHPYIELCILYFEFLEQ